MSKGLEALERIKREAGTPYFSTLYDIDMWREDFATIEKELKECEMEHTLRIRLENINYELVREKQENEKKVKVLEIIKEIIKVFPITSREMLIKSCISKEKQDLLKEVIKNDL